MMATFCLALALYVEARGEPIDGQTLVAEVITNRVKSERYPSDVCGVVFDTKQFSGITPTIDFGKVFLDPAWVVSVSVATEALSGNTFNSGATHYHTTEVEPYWADHMIQLGQYGNHIFYKDEMQ